MKYSIKVNEVRAKEGSKGSAYSTINLILISINCYFLILEFDLKITD